MVQARSASVTLPSFLGSGWSTFGAGGSSSDSKLANGLRTKVRESKPICFFQRSHGHQRREERV